MAIHSIGPLPRLKSFFMFLNLWVDRDDFLGFVADTWQTPVDGNPTYNLTKRLGLLQPKLKTLHHLHTSHISSCVVETNTKWAATLTLLDDSPQFNEYQRVKRKLAREFFQLSKGDKAFYKHKSQIQWLNLEDRKNQVLSQITHSQTSQE
jgi:hypothetical protein